MSLMDGEGNLVKICIMNLPSRFYAINLLNERGSLLPTLSDITSLKLG